MSVSVSTLCPSVDAPGISVEVCAKAAELGFVSDFASAFVSGFVSSVWGIPTAASGDLMVAVSGAISLVMPLVPSPVPSCVVFGFAFSGALLRACR